MYLLMTDETNLQASDRAKFFIYGGLIVPLNKAVELDRRISKARIDAGYLPQDEFKFDTNSRPEERVTREAATDAKQKSIQACMDCECLFIVYLIHHGIVRNQAREEKIMWAANHVIGRFNKFLVEQNTYGICMVDRLPILGEYRYLTDKFTKGLDSSGGRHIILNRILLYGSTCINASHLASAVDIVLGSFRYCANEPRNIVAAREMLSNVVSLMWCKVEGNTRYLRERGLILRPKEVNAQQYKQDYENLIEWFKALLGDNDA